MFDINNIYIYTKKDLNNYVSDEDIYIYYIGEFENNQWIKSPLRTEDDASFRISFYNGEWKWTDFGISNNPKNAVEFVAQYFNISIAQAYDKIYNDIYLNKEHKKITINTPITNEIESYCKIRNYFHDWELEYWSKANITAQDLKYWDIYSGEIRNNGIIWHKSKIGDPLFIYMFDKKNQIYKGYRPLSKDSRLKFYGKNVAGHIQGYDKLPEKGDILIITKSYKDIIVWSKLGYPAIAPHTENMFISPFDIYDLQTRFKTIYVNYDNDATGVKKCIEYTNEYGLNYFNLPLDTGCKDPFAFVVEYSYEDLEELFKQKLKRDETTRVNRRSEK